MTSTVTLTIYEETRKGRVTDTTDYSFDLTQTNAVILGKIYFNNEVLYSFTDVSAPMIDLQSGATYYEFDLETNDDVGNTPASGTYEIRDYQLVVDLPVTGIIGDVSLPYLSTIVTTGVSDFLSNVTNGTDFEITSGVNEGDWTVDSAEVLSGVLFVYVAAQMTTEGDVDAFMRIAYDSFADKSYTYDGCDEATINAQASYDCDYGDFGSFTGYDDTDYGTHTLVTSTMIITPPGWTQELDSPPSPVTITQASRISHTITELYTLTYTVQLTNTLTYTQTDDLIVIYEITQIREKVVSCAGSFCCSVACFEKLRAAHYASFTSPSSVSPYQKYYDNALGYYLEAQQYKACGEQEKYQTAAAAFEDAIDSSGLCTCSDCDDNEARKVVNGSTDTINAITNLEAFQATISAIPIDELIYELTSPVTGTAPSALDAIAIPAKFITQNSVTNKHGIFITIQGFGDDGTSGITVRNTTTGIDIFTSTGRAGYYRLDISIVKGASTNTMIYKSRLTHYDNPVDVVDATAQVAWTWATINNLRITQVFATDQVQELTINGSTVNA